MNLDLVIFLFILWESLWVSMDKKFLKIINIPNFTGRISYTYTVNEKLFQLGLKDPHIITMQTTAVRLYEKGLMYDLFW